MKDDGITEPEPGAQLDELVDDTSMNARIEHAYNKALEFEQRGLNDFVDSGEFLFISVRAIRLTACFVYRHCPTHLRVLVANGYLKAEPAAAPLSKCAGG